MMIYNYLLQQISYFEFGFEFEFVGLWCHNQLVTQSDACVTKPSQCDMGKFGLN